MKDPKGAVVRRARITLIARDNTVQASTTSDENGGYEFDHVAVGSYLLSATAHGFEAAQTQNVEVSGKASIHADLQLRLAAVATSVTVTASGTAQTADEVAKSLSVVDARTLQSLDTSTIANALNYVAGLRVEQLGGPEGIVSIKTRGLRSQDTAVLVDGFRFRDASATQGDASGLLQDLLLSNSDRIEVLRGTGSSIYGTNATGGVVNVITNAGSGRTRGSVLLEGGSLDTFRGMAAVSGTLSSRFGYSLGIAHLNVVSGIDGDLPDRNSGLQGRFDYSLSSKTQIVGRLFMTDTFSRLTDGPTVAGNIPSTGIVDAVALAGSELRRLENGTPVSELNLGNANFIPNADNPDYSRTARNYSGALIVSTHPNDEIGFTASYQGLVTHRNFDNGPLGLGYQPYGGNEQNGYDGAIHTVSGRMDWRLGKYQSINAGYEFENENYYGTTIEPDVTQDWTANITQRNHGLFVQDQIHLLGDRLQLGASYRAQFFSLDRPVFQPTESAPYADAKPDAVPRSNTWDVSGAYLFRESGTKIRAHFGTGYRAPSLFERYGSGYYGIAASYSAYGDPELKPERTKAIDAGIDQSFWNRRAQASATYFYTRLNEVITWNNYLDSTTDPYARFYGYTNTKGGIARGVETNLSITPARSLNVRAAYTYTNAREAEPQVAGVYQTFVTPDHQFSILATAQVTPRFTLVFGTVLTSDYLAPIYDSVTYENRAFRFEGMKRGQVGASYRMPMGDSQAMRFFVNLQNAFDQSYYESGYRTPGTTAMSGVQFEF